LDARENSERLLAMVNNLLAWRASKRDRSNWMCGQNRPTGCSNTPPRPSATEPRTKASSSCSMHPRGLPPVAVDVTAPGHALRNLLDNALAYTDRGGRITLLGPRDPEGVTLSLPTPESAFRANTSPCLREFFRVPGQSRGTGTGLGTGIVQEIVTAHGGSISCESRPGLETVFRLRLPLAGRTWPLRFVSVWRCGRVNPPRPAPRSHVK